MFHGPWSVAQACDTVIAVSQGLREAQPNCWCGHNIAGHWSGFYIVGRLAYDPESRTNYCGVDGYPGSWGGGGPEWWAERVSELHEMTGQPVIINEWGFPTRGKDPLPPGEPQPSDGTCGQHWPNTWGEGHTPEAQAEYIRQALRAFDSVSDKLLGSFFYRWEDQAKCYHCGSPDCPGVGDRGQKRSTQTRFYRVQGEMGEIKDVFPILFRQAVRGDLARFKNSVDENDQNKGTFEQRVIRPKTCPTRERTELLRRFHFFCSRVSPRQEVPFSQAKL